MGAVALAVLALPAAGRLYAEPVYAGPAARLMRSSRKEKHPKAKPAAVSTAQMELARQMVRTAYTLGTGLEIRQRVALTTRLLYTMRPEVMAVEKREWAEEVFGLAQQLPLDGAGAAGAGGYAAKDAAPAAALGGYAAKDAAPAAGAEAIAIAAARLALYDSDRALELLDGLPSQGGTREDGRTMAARLVFAVYMQHHGTLGAQTLLAHGRRWGEHGGFPYTASATVLGRLRSNEDAAEYFFREVLVTFEREQEGLFGVCDFAGLLERAAAMEAISEDAAEEAGRNIVRQLRKLAEGENQETWSEAQKRQVTEALYDVRVSAPKAFEEAQKTVPGLLALRPAKVAVTTEIPKVDVGLQAAFREMAEAMRERRTPEEMRAVIARGLQLVNARYSAGGCAECAGSAAGAGGYAVRDAAPAAGAGGYGPTDGPPAAGPRRLAPDAQSWALVSLAANASPMTIATQLNVIRDPFWHGYFLAIAAQQVGEPTRVADPTSRKVGKEEAEPE
jgi:hypothetical protein